jgi:hypothetical protein
MTIFDFGKRQRMHTQLVGHTSGHEMFLVDEYNTKKKISTAIISYNIFLLTLMYFAFDFIKTKTGIFFVLIGLAGLGYGYFNFKSQRVLRSKFY